MLTHKNFTINENVAIQLELVAKTLNRSVSSLVSELLAKGLTREAIIKECQLAKAQKLIAEAQFKLLSNSEPGK